MKKELDDMLVKRFPVLYQDRRSPMTQTCMCWGFDCGDGWFEIIWQLSLAIENELEYSRLQERWFLFKKQFACRWNKVIYYLSPVRRDEYKSMGAGTNGDPFRQMRVKEAEPTWDEAIVRFFFGEMQKIGKYEMKRLGLKKLIWHPYTGLAVNQVKEKYGTLRVYCPGNDIIFKYVLLAERLSAVTCEICGKPGKTAATHGWYSTLCTECRGRKENE